MFTSQIPNLMSMLLGADFTPAQANALAMVFGQCQAALTQNGQTNLNGPVTLGGPVTMGDGSTFPGVMFPFQTASAIASGAAGNMSPFEFDGTGFGDSDPSAGNDEDVGVPSTYPPLSPGDQTWATYNDRLGSYVQVTPGQLLRRGTTLTDLNQGDCCSVQVEPSSETYTACDWMIQSGYYIPAGAKVIIAWIDSQWWVIASGTCSKLVPA